MPESQNIEYKSSWRDEYLKWICGFANAQGGKLYIGIDDNGEVCGVQNAKKLMEDIPNKIREALGILVDVNLLSVDSKEYLEISVSASSDPINYKGEYHYRSGSTKQLLQGPALTQFLLNRTRIKWDAAPIDGVEFKDLDKDNFDTSTQKSTQKSIQKRTQKIIELIASNPSITTQEMADSLGVSRSAIAKAVAKMQKNGIISRVGPDKGGYWQIAKNS